MTMPLDTPQLPSLDEVTAPDFEDAHGEVKLENPADDDNETPSPTPTRLPSPTQERLLCVKLSPRSHRTTCRLLPRFHPVGAISLTRSNSGPSTPTGQALDVITEARCPGPGTLVFVKVAPRALIFSGPLHPITTCSGVSPLSTQHLSHVSRPLVPWPHRPPHPHHRPAQPPRLAVHLPPVPYLRSGPPPSPDGGLHSTQGSHSG